MPDRPMHHAKSLATVEFGRDCIEITSAGYSVQVRIPVGRHPGATYYEVQEILAKQRLEVSEEDRARLDSGVAAWRGDGIYLDVTQCRACRSDIRWRTTPAGKNMPLEVTPHLGPAKGTYVIVNDHECRPSDPLFDNNERNFMNHWVKCPMADELRGGKK